MDERRLNPSDKTPKTSGRVLRGVKSSYCSRDSVAWVRCVLGCVVCLLLLLVGCEAQGRLVDPPSRASMWRYDFSNPVDFNDDQVDCGGFVRQWRKNQGRCGVCGDPWDLPEPRPHETRGRYARGIIVRNLTQAQAVVVEVEVTATGSGYFEYKLCPRISAWTPETQGCFSHSLKDDLDRSQIPVNVTQKFARIRHVLRLPQEVVCPACVLQWKFVTEGRARREEYRACADITINPVTPPITTTPVTTTPVTNNQGTDNTTITPVTNLNATDSFTTTTTTTTDTATADNLITESPTTTITLLSLRGEFDLSTTQMSDTNFGSPTLKSPKSQVDAPRTHTRTQIMQNDRSSDTGEEREESGAYSVSSARPYLWSTVVVFYILISPNIN